jgi:hypothetical protein
MGVESGSGTWGEGRACRLGRQGRGAAGAVLAEFFRATQPAHSVAAELDRTHGFRAGRASTSVRRERGMIAASPPNGDLRHGQRQI